MSGRSRLIIAAVVGLLVIVGLYFLAIRPKKAELVDLRAQVEQENQKTNQLDIQLAHLRELQANAPEAQAELARIQQFVPEKHEVPNFVFQVQTAANEAGVEVVHLQPTLPKTPLEGAAVAEVPVQIDAKGGYFAIQDFIRRLYDLKRALRIDTIGLTAETDEETGDTVENLTITSRIFFELPAVVAPVAPVVPGAVPAATPSPTVP